MSTIVRSMVDDYSTDANFRQMSNLHDVICIGNFWVQATDTGQINWSTVLHPAGINTDQGFEIYKTTDALSSTFQLFMKVTYGSNTGTIGGTIRLKFQFGTGTNGAGTITGQVGNTHTTEGNVASDGSAYGAFYASGGPGYWAMHAWNSPAVNARNTFGLAVERSKDNNGNYTASYFTYVGGFANGAGAVTSVQRTILPASMTTELGNAFSLFFSAGSTAGWGTYAVMFPVYPFQGYPDNVMTAVMGMKTGDIQNAETFDCTIYGVTHRYLWTNRGGAALGSATGMSNLGFGIRYE